MKKIILFSLALLTGAFTYAGEMPPEAQAAAAALSKAEVVKDTVLGGSDAKGNAIKPSELYTADAGLVDTNDLPTMIALVKQHKSMLEDAKNLTAQINLNINDLLTGYSDVYNTVVNRLDRLEKEQREITSSTWGRFSRWAKKSARQAMSNEVLQNVAKQAMAEKAAEYHPNATRIIAGAYGVDVDTEAAKKRAAERAAKKESEADKAKAAEAASAAEAHKQMVEMAGGQQTAGAQQSSIPDAPALPEEGIEAWLKKQRAAKQTAVPVVQQPAASPSRSALLEQIREGKELKGAPVVQQPAASPSRSALLEQIQKGTQLKKTTPKLTVETPSTPQGGMGEALLASPAFQKAITEKGGSMYLEDDDSGGWDD